MTSFPLAATSTRGPSRSIIAAATCWFTGLSSATRIRAWTGGPGAYETRGRSLRCAINVS